MGFAPRGACHALLPLLHLLILAIVAASVALRRVRFYVHGPQSARSRDASRAVGVRVWFALRR
eukprot:1184400-Rhodomonas_salina.3